MKTYFWDKNEHPLHVDGMYAGAACFLVVSGPSLKMIDMSKLQQPGIVSFGVNNSENVIRPTMWVSVDDPANFIISVWKDPLIKKFAMLGKKNKRLWDNNKWCDSRLTVMDCPNVVYYKDNEHFKPTADFLDEETINWGNHTDRCECGHMRGKDENGKKIHECPKCHGRKFGARSVMLAALKIAYVLGFRKVFIVGADFEMRDDNKYAFTQERTQSSIKNNNDTYTRLNERFAALRPIFEQHKFFVFNSTPGGNLNAFPRVAFDDAVQMALGDFPDTATERTYGMYERKAVDKEIIDSREKIVALRAELSKDGADERQVKRINKHIEKAEVKLRNAMESKERLLTWTA
jgi:hypothetical protein